MANTTERILNLREAGSAGDSLPVDAQAEDPSALSIDGTAKIRLNEGVIEASIDGAQFSPLATGTNPFDVATDLGMRPSNTAAENSAAWDAAMAAIPVGGAAWWVFETGTYNFARTCEINRQVRITGTGFTTFDGTRFLWNTGNMSGIWVHASETGDGSGEDTQIENIRINSGGYNVTYSGGRTATADGSTTIVLTGHDGELRLGRWLLINGVLSSVVAIAPDLVTYTMSESIPAGTGLAIAFGATAGIWFTGRCLLSRIFVGGGFLDGFYGYGNIASLTNVSTSVLFECSAVESIRDGFRVAGPDANNIGFYTCSASANGAWGFNDLGFLGNSYFGCHAENNVDAYRTADSNAHSSYLGCYAEAGQDIDISVVSVWVGGIVGGSTAAFIGPGIALAEGYFVGNAPKFIMQNGAGSSGYTEVGWGRIANAIGKFVAPLGDGGESWSDKWNEAGAILSYCVGRGIWGNNGDAAQYWTGSNTKNINTGNTKASFPYSAFSRGFYLGGRRWNVLDAQSGGLSISTAVFNLLGPGWAINWGDLFWDLRPVAGEHVGWRCVTSGTTGTYTDGLTATSAGGTSLTLSGSNVSLAVGQYVTVDGVVTQVVSVSGTSLVVAHAITAGAGKVISYTAPVYQSIGRLSGGAGDSTGTPGNAALNTVKGRSAIAAGAAAVVITNSLVSATSNVQATLQTIDGTLFYIRAVCTANTITITGNANATGNCNVAWSIVE